MIVFRNSSATLTMDAEYNPLAPFFKGDFVKSPLKKGDSGGCLCQKPMSLNCYCFSNTGGTCERIVNFRVNHVSGTAYIESAYINLTILVLKLCLGTHLVEKLRFGGNHTFTLN